MTCLIILFGPQAIVLEEREELSNAVSIEELNGAMAYRSELENLDEDGYTQLQFSSRDITGRPVSSEKGIFFFPPSTFSFSSTKTFNQVEKI